MNREEFLAQLKTALGGNIDDRLVQENLNYYHQYITEEMQKGKSEQEILDMLGDPWILARTIIDANDGTDRETVYEAGGTGGSYSEKKTGETTGGTFADLLRMDTWWKRLLVILAVVLVVLLVVSIVTGLIRLFAPLLLPLLLVALVVRLLGKRKS